MKLIKLLDALLALLLPALVLLHLALAPYTKVEESFNIQAAHDVLVYGTPTGAGAGARLAARYDHFTFPGAVPRTFVGAVLLAGVGQPLILAADYVKELLTGAGAAGSGMGGPAAQLVVRAVLGLANAAALVALARSLAAACGRPAGRWYLLLQASQFHVVFYASRTLPNMFAFFLTTLAFSFLLSPQGGPSGSRSGSRSSAGRVRVALCLLVFAGVVFRAEVALLVAAVGAYLVVAPLASAERIVRTVAVAAAVALALSVPIDTYFWQTFPPTLFWPELHGFIFNVVAGQATAWGTSPWHYYATSALPRLLLNPLVPLVLLPVALTRPATRGPAALLAWPSLAFVAAYSLQPHKEARFILYVVPPLTAAAALGADQLHKQSGKGGPLARAVLLALAASIPLALAASTLMLLVSALNYPGGEALAALRQLVAADPGAASAVTAHADVLACMTGVTLFGSTLGAALAAAAAPEPVAVVGTAAPAAALVGAAAPPEPATDASALAPGGPPQLVVDKTEDARQLRDPAFWAQFDYLLVENPKAVPGRPAQWDAVAVVQGYAGVEVLRPGQTEEEDSQKKTAKVVGHGATLARVRRAVRARTGGWWVGPRMAPRIYILQRVKGDGIGGGGAADGSRQAVVL